MTTAAAPVRHHTGSPVFSDASWVGVDWDGTLVGKDDRPVAALVHLVKRLLELGVTVKIFTARASEKDPMMRHQSLRQVDACCKQWFGTELPITCEKDKYCYCIVDDRAVAVHNGTGGFMDPNHLIAKLFEKRA